MSEPLASDLSLANIAEAWLRSGIRKEHEISLPSTRRALDGMRERTNSSHPLAAILLLTNGASLLFEAFDEYVDASRRGQLEWRALVEPCLKRIERGPDGNIVRMFPESRVHPMPDEHPVVIDPEVHFGGPCVAGTGMPTAVLFDRWTAGDSREVLETDFDLDVSQIDEALDSKRGMPTNLRPDVLRSFLNRSISKNANAGRIRASTGPALGRRSSPRDARFRWIR